MAEQFGDKTHEATQHRREQARDEGHVVRSHDLSSAILLVTSISLLIYLGGGLATFFAKACRYYLQAEPTFDASSQTFIATAQQIVGALATNVLPLLGLMVLAAVLAQLGQFGLLFLPEKLAFDYSRIDPLKGWQRLVSLSSVVRIGFGIFKIVVVMVVAYWSLVGRWDQIRELSSRDVPEIAVMMVEITLWTALKIAVALLILALLDYGYQRWKYELDLRMTTQEMREEFRSLQGDPQIINRRKTLQRQLVLNRMRSAVPQADVVITNPTELAIAIQYDVETMAAPVVVAKGAGLVAQRIRRLALENSVPVVERKELARVLYKAVDIGKPIPPEHYTTMAEILRYVYQLKGKSLPNLRSAA